MLFCVVEYNKIMGEIMNDWIEEMRNQSEYFADIGPLSRPNHMHGVKENEKVVKKSHTSTSKAKLAHNEDDKQLEHAKRSLEHFCDRQYNFFISKLKDCEGKRFHSELFDHSHSSGSSIVHTDLAYCYDRGLFFAENENDDLSIFAILPIFDAKNYHCKFYGATRKTLTNASGEQHFAYVGFVRDNCKSHVFQENFSDESIVSKLPHECPVTGISASQLFTVLNSKYSDCKDALSLLTKNHHANDTMEYDFNQFYDDPTM